jgi:regulator of replication initiation timing
VGLTPRKRGRKPNPDSELLRHNARLRRENEQLRKQLARAESIIDIQKKVASLLGIPLNRPENVDSD